MPDSAPVTGDPGGDVSGLSRLLDERANASAAVRDESGCLGFDIVELAGDDGRFLLYERYADEAAFVDHQLRPHFATWSEVAPTLLVGDRQRLTGEVVTSLADAHPSPTPPDV
ncbi:putative quinol monooxygenase [Angustibacter luteus]|uniref:Quinol monooxygenase n=1 Tax=Angustibacter luteus TaxID=658456 RepID=A0ABW1JDK3_9ACTN